MNKLEFISFDEFQSCIQRLYNVIPHKAFKSNRWTTPPKEYKSSLYRVWANTGVMIDIGNGTKIVGQEIYFRDEADYLLAVLMK